MFGKRSISRTMLLLFLATITAIFATSVVLAQVEVEPHDSTYYDYNAACPTEIRNLIKSKVVKLEKKQGLRTELTAPTNDTPITQRYYYEYESVSSATVELGAKIPKKVVELTLDIKIVVFSSREKISTSVKVPGNSTYHVYISQDTNKWTIDSTVQQQGYFQEGTWILTGSWRDIGTPTKSKTIWTEKYTSPTISEK